MVRARLASSGQFLAVAGDDPLTAIRWVDPATTVPLADRNGMISQPFATVQAAVDSLVGVAQSAIMLAPGDYAAEAVSWSDPAGELLVLCGFGGVRNIGAIASALDARLRLVALGTQDSPVAAVTLTDTSLEVLGGSWVADVTAAGSPLKAWDSRFSGAVVVGSLDAFEAVFDGAFTGNAAANALRSRFRGETSLVALTAWDSSFEDALTLPLGVAAPVTAWDCSFVALTGGEWTAVGCSFAGVAGFELLTAIGCSFDTDAQSLGLATLLSCRCGNVTALVLDAIGCSFATGAAATLSVSSCVFGGAVAASSLARVTDSQLRAGISALGAAPLEIDASSYSFALQNGPVTFGSLVFVDPPSQATISILVPAVAAGSVGYVNTSLVGSALESLFGAANAPVSVNPQTDLVAAGLGGGFLNARISAADTLRCAFVGPLAGGAANFTVARVK